MGGVVAVVCFGLLGFAHHLDAEPNAHGAQTTLGSYGIPACSFKQVTGLPCATCGMTRSFALMTDGRFIDAARMQPAGALLALGVAMAGLTALWATMTGMALGPLANALWRPRLIIALLAMILMAWALRILQTLGAPGP